MVQFLLQSLPFSEPVLVHSSNLAFLVLNDEIVDVGFGLASSRSYKR